MANASRAVTLVQRALPRPHNSGGMNLFDAFAERRSTRQYVPRELPLQTLSDLLWSAFGVNRPNGDRTAPYWRHVMVMDIYLAMSDGVWFYEPKAHTLLPHVTEDIRAKTGKQEFVATAPLNLIYVAHGERMDVPETERRLYASVDAAFIGENVYLFCASEGLGSVFRANLDYDELAHALRLPEDQFITFAQTVGYPNA